MQQIIHVQGLTKSYGSVHAVRGIDFEVLPGEIFGLLGPNGAGKTSTLEILEGFRRRSSGSVSVLGLDPGNRAQLAELRRRTSVVLQHSAHYRFLSVREVLEMHRGYYDDPRSSDEVLELVELADADDRRVGRLSGGQQRRLDVAVALIGRPELIFLDELTTGFDPAARQRAWRTLAALRDLGTTVLLTTHYMEEAQRLADRVAIMRDGAIVGVGRPDELAAQIGLNSRIAFLRPEGVELVDLPESLRGAASEQGGVVTVETASPTAAMAELCSWAVQRGVELQQLQLQPPDLEASYMALTEPATVLS